MISLTPLGSLSSYEHALPVVEESCSLELQSHRLSICINCPQFIKNTISTKCVSSNCDINIMTTVLTKICPAGNW